VLLQENLPIGVVTTIAGAVRHQVTIIGTAGHAGTVPMSLRRDAATAAAEIVLYVERRCAAVPTLVGTVGQLTVPDGAINIIPGCCELTLDIRAGEDAVREAAVTDVRAEIGRIAQRRGVTIEAKEVVRGNNVPCTPSIQQLLADAVARAGVPIRYLPSGAGHDAMLFAGVTDIGMLFVRCGNGGVSHSPREIITAEDADIAGRVLLDAVIQMGAKP
jgi:allantoate deiminase/N-carbamoyl-L-amino-acid hydrolase